MSIQVTAAQIVLCSSEQFGIDMGQTVKQKGEGEEEDSSESDSIRTAIPQNTIDNFQSFNQVIGADQILSVNNLARNSVASETDEDFLEIDLNTEEDQQTRQERASDEMFAVYRKQPDDSNFQAIDNQMTTKRTVNQQNDQDLTRARCNGFSDAQATKVTFASRRMKEYFKSFRSHKGETLRLYQFFKSTRTELVACLLFTLITSQALIVLRTNLIDERTTWPLNPATIQQQVDHLAPSGSAHPLQPQDNSSPLPISNSNPSHEHEHQQLHQPVATLDNRPPLMPQKSGVVVHLAHGLVIAFTVASLTQIFGHISGCHLIPSISLALYVKGHISRLRLASYLAAQFLGSALGVSLLSLLSSSQMSQSDYQAMLLNRINLQPQPLATHHYYREPLYLTQQLDSADQQRQSITRHLRVKRESAFDAQKLDRDALAGIDSDNNDSQQQQQQLQGSETILLSIMEQLERQQQKQQQPSPAEREHRKQVAAASSSSEQKRTEPAPGEGAAGEQLRQFAEFGVVQQQEHEAKRIVPTSSIDVEKTITVNVNTFHTSHHAAPNNGSNASSNGANLVSRTSVLELTPRANSEQHQPPAATVSPAPSTTTTTTNSATATTTASITIVHETSSPASASLRHWNYSESASEVERGLGSGGESQIMLSLFNDRSRVVSSASAQVARFEGAPNAADAIEDVARLFVSSSTTARPNNASSNHNAVSWGGSDNISADTLNRQESITTSHQSDKSDSLPVTSSRRPKLKRRKRNKQQQQQANATKAPLPQIPAGEHQHRPLSSDHFINLLEFTLPDQIMSSESIRQCIDKQLASFASAATTANQTTGADELASNCFRNCISLSNSSQMFIFQFLATLLVVLTYLVNVDPRRIDPGFKSLSIGLSYFVACTLTVQSGGFYGNPFHLVFLSWLSTTGEWRSEWFVYLITPLIAGIFSAISHEYIDFSSLKNRNKQLHLRRSFYSIDNIGQSAVGSEAAATPGTGEEPRAYLEMCGLRQGAATAAPSGELSARRQLSSSSSLDSTGACTSSVLSFTGGIGGDNMQQPAKTPPQPQPRAVAAASSSSDTYSNATISRSKLARYPRPPRVLDHQRHTTLRPDQGQSASSLRRSGFDSNFLISSSGSGNAASGQTSSSLSSASSTSPQPQPPAATRRQLPPPANGWM